ncbi:glycosyltransferase involved in cell wall biosynthesis [Salegentibacter sp. 24]|uniref:glycosyltransferase n=1 Tax=Salegentibacter sp. 24 TaxID=2183986 RepID=UPI00105EA31A|nr:glycosyltransferase [Salegentibacter sp. 24]TDN89137.1 glycosyltransferase involved in cell wall biosynthesis [Salegentibacter sp. 24]
MKNFAVSVFILTYNQEDFIANTLESILNQETNFKYQLVIGEDLSSDATRQICETYAEKYPEKIKLLPSNRRLGLINNFIRTIKACDGKYIAVCDGDDYWIEPLKLQKQYDFLESRPDFSIVYTGIRNLYPTGEFKDKTWDHSNNSRNFDELIFGNFIPSVTAFYRNKQNEVEIPNWIKNFPYGDWPVYLWLTRNGDKVGYIDEITGVYRKEIGVSEKMKRVSSDIAKVNLGIVQYVYDDCQFSNKIGIVKKSLVKHKYGLMGSYFREGKLIKSFIEAGDLFYRQPFKVIKTYLYLTKRALVKTF